MKIQVSHLAFYLAVVAAAVVLLEETTLTHAATCSITGLSPCLPALQTGAPPSATCCAKVRQQGPCLCGYLKNPAYKQYLGSAKKIASACKVSIKC
ncbi:hypothetical protein Nepgr_029053 [Nepenthes gracilis]|uniref:Bifunctional inhibitor/plant lipid transfer protein/seed storage helical domain-containing protein n=1 Tax=Nepenthes gracilis TaxID=150966 RepID=A0AAD3Y4I1_NEPGR|nr:hypothetical protein Nepgr_029053 [Nepenthes gracilis]